MENANTTSVSLPVADITMHVNSGEEESPPSSSSIKLHGPQLMNVYVLTAPGDLPEGTTLTELYRRQLVTLVGLIQRGESDIHTVINAMATLMSKSEAERDHVTKLYKNKKDEFNALMNRFLVREADISNLQKTNETLVRDVEQVKIALDSEAKKTGALQVAFDHEVIKTDALQVAFDQETKKTAALEDLVRKLVLDVTAMKNMAEHQEHKSAELKEFADYVSTTTKL